MQRGKKSPGIDQGWRVEKVSSPFREYVLYSSFGFLWDVVDRVFVVFLHPVHAERLLSFSKRSEYLQEDGISPGFSQRKDPLFHETDFFD